MKKSPSTFLTPLFTGLAGFAIGLALAYDLSDTNKYDTDMLKITERNMAVFNAMPHLATLNQQNRSQPWEVRQKNISRLIAKYSPASDNADATDEPDGPKLVHLMNAADTAMVPHRESGRVPKLLVGSDRSCLMVNFEESDQEIANDAIALLKTFYKAGQQKLNHQGRYLLEQGLFGDRAVVFTPNDSESLVNQYCAAPAAPAMK